MFFDSQSAAGGCFALRFRNQNHSHCINGTRIPARLPRKIGNCTESQHSARIWNPNRGIQSALSGFPFERKISIAENCRCLCAHGRFKPMGPGVADLPDRSRRFEEPPGSDSTETKPETKPEPAARAGTRLGNEHPECPHRA